jgi:hypothetical protein
MAKFAQTEEQHEECLLFAKEVENGGVMLSPDSRPESFSCFGVILITSTPQNSEDPLLARKVYALPTKSSGMFSLRRDQDR